MSSEFNEMFQTIFRVLGEGIEEEGRKQQKVKGKKGEILERDKDPWGINLIETGLVRVGNKYFYIEIHEEIFDNRRHAKVWRARKDGSKKGMSEKYRAGSVKKVLRALIDELE